MDEKGKKIWACLLSILMVISTLAIVGNTTAIQPEDVPNITVDENGIPELKVTELRATTSVISLAQKNRLVLSVSNQGDATAYKVTANVTAIIPRHSENLISVEHLGALQPQMEKTRFIDWYPSQRGIHYIKVELKCEYLTHNSPAEMIEGPPTILSVGFPVAQAGPTETWGPVHDYPSVITASEGVRYRDGPLTIEVYDDLVIESGAKLQLNASVTLVMLQQELPTIRHDITIESGARFIIESPSRNTTITKSASDPASYTYPFHNSGTVEFTGADVTYTYGDRSDLANPGGIQNHVNSVCNLTDCHVELADTHSIVANNSDLKIMGADTLVGKADAFADASKGHGVWIVEDSNAIIDGIRIKHSERNGVNIYNSDAVINNSVIESNGVCGIYSNLSSPTITNTTIGGDFIDIENETVHGPSTGGETGPIYLANENIINCSLYADVEGEWCPLAEGAGFSMPGTIIQQEVILMVCIVSNLLH